MDRTLRNALGVCLVALCPTLAFAQETENGPPRRTKSDASEKADDIPASASKSGTDDSPAPAGDDVKLTFNFRYQPWQEVLDWFADQAGLSLLIESPPTGTFNYRDSRSYTPAEALDVLNGVLLTKGYTLVRRGRMLVLVNLEDGVPPNLVPDVPLEELDKRGEYELIRVLFPVWNMTPEQAAEEVQPILGPQGKVVTLPQARQIQVTETAGRLRTIRSIVNAVEQPELGTAGLREFKLKYITFDAAMPTLRNMLGIPAEAYSTPDGSMQLTKSAIGETILFRGTAQHAARLEEILRLIDVPEAASGIDGTPQLEVYPITTADPEAVLKVLQQLMRDNPNVTLATDKEAGHIVAFASPPQQATIRATIDQMQKDNRKVDVIALTNTDPQVAVLAINKLFGSLDDKPDPKAPRVDADLNSRSLLVRGTAGQVEQIRDLLRQLGETEDGAESSSSSQQHVRMLPLTGSAARSALEQIEQIWPTMRSNRIRIVSPSATINTYRPSDSGEPSPDAEERAPVAAPGDDLGTDYRQLLDLLRSGNSDDRPVNRESKPDGADNRKTPFRYASEQSTDGSTEPAEDIAPSPQPPAPRPTTKKGAPIIVAPGPGGLLIASDDLEALDELEELLTAVAGRNAASGREFAVFYLKYSKAATVAEVLASIFGGSTGGNDRGLIGDMASNALGDVGGALMGDLLLGGSGSGGSSFTSSNVEIVPDARLNALIVQAKPADLDTMEQLLKVLDQRTGPEDVEADGQPRSIPVYNASASDIAQTIQQLYQDRIAGGGANISPQEMMKMLRGGPNTEQQIAKMSIAVDTRNNMLIVRAPDPLFEEIKLLVEELDEMEADSPETTRVVSLKHTNSAAVQKALTSILDNVQTGTTSAQTPTSSSSDRRRDDDDDDDSPGERARRDMRRNWEMMQEMRRFQERMGGDRGSSGGSDRSRFFGGQGGDSGRGRGGDDGDRGRGGDDGRRGRD
jgi:type II secretory pathway component GspD/PulD (secretin)